MIHHNAARHKVESFDRLYLGEYISYEIENAECYGLGLNRVCCKESGVPGKFTMITINSRGKRKPISLIMFKIEIDARPVLN